jgi:hypothetical protein
MAPSDCLIAWRTDEGRGASVEAYSRRDTLVVRSRGMRTLTIALSGEPLHCLRVNGGTAKRLRPAPNSAGLLVSLAMASSRPRGLETTHFYYLHLPTH